MWNKLILCLNLSALFTALIKVFTDIKEENWMIPVVIAAAVDLRRFAYVLDTTSKKKVESQSAYGSHLERVAQSIMKLFQVCAADR